MRVWILSGVVLALLLPDHDPHGPWLATFSIVCRDPKTGDFGVGVTTQPQGVRRLCPFARAGVGAVSTQAYVNTALGPRGLDLMAQGKTPKQALDQALNEDSGRQQRQLAMIDGKNPPAAFTGSGADQWKGSVQGKNFSTQGNILVSSKTLEAVAETFEKTPGSLAGRIIAALRAGKKAGGDKRGHNSCAVIIASRRASGRLLIDLSEDSNPDPVERVAEQFLQKCVAYMQLGDRDLKPKDQGADVIELEQGLKNLGHLKRADQFFTKETTEAVTTFQKAAGLAETGLVNPETARALVKAVEANKSLGDRELQEGDEGKDVRELEEALKGQGHFQGDPDAVFDAATTAAVRAYQKAKRFRQTGVVDARTSRALVKAEKKRKRKAGKKD